MYKYLWSYTHKYICNIYMLIFLSSVSYKFQEADNTVSISILNLSLLIPFSNNMETGLLKRNWVH